MLVTLAFFLVLASLAPALVAETSTLTVDLTTPRRTMPNTLFGVFFEEINHAGSGGLWAELVSNRGFEAGGTHSSDIRPWGVIGNESDILVSTDLSSPFEQNRVALRVEIPRDSQAGVGFYNPGFWGMNIEKGRRYRVIFYLRSVERVENVSVSFTDFNGTHSLASSSVSSSRPLNWTRMEVVLIAKTSNPTSRLQFTTNRKGLLWFDQISAMPTLTYKGHGFRTDVFQMIADLRPAFMRFPGGTFVEGVKLSNSFHWKKTVGPWEERPGHFGDVWDYWTDDGLGFFEQLLLAEDLESEPIWVVNCGISREEHANISYVQQFVREMLDGIEFARGDASSTWGSVRSRMGHPQPFQLRYAAIGNEDCDFPFYKENYMKFYKALKQSYPDIQAISNCDGSRVALDHPADIFDYHIYTSPAHMFSLRHAFDSTPRDGAKVFVSEYAVRGEAGLGNLLAALAEAAFLMGVEKNSDIVSMVCYAPLLVNTNDRNWNPDALVVSSSSVYGTPSYWMQRFFVNSSGASLVSSNLQSDDTLAASVVSWRGVDDKTYLTVKVVNFGNKTVDFTIMFNDQRGSKPLSGLLKTILTSPNVTDENTFQDPTKVHPVTTPFKGHGNSFKVSLPPYSLQAFDLSVHSTDVVHLNTTPLMPLAPYHPSPETTKAVWDILATAYALPSRGHIKQRKYKLKNMSIFDCMHKIQAITDELAFLHPLSTGDLIDRFIEGLDSNYQSVIDAINARDFPIAFPELLEKLIHRELTIQLSKKPPVTSFQSAIAPPTSISLTAHHVTGDGSSVGEGHVDIMYLTLVVLILALINL